MSQSKRVSTASRQDARSTAQDHGSATTAEGIAGERAVLAARSGSGKTARATRAARRLEQASQADARAR